MSEKLLTSKKKIETGKWNYRNFIVEKIGSQWVAKLSENNSLEKEKTDQIIDTKEKSAKVICLNIDKVLGDLTAAEQNQPKPKAKSKAQKLKDKEDKDKYLEKAMRIAYIIRNGITVLECLNKKEVNELTSDAPNNRKSLKNGYKLGWVNGCLYDIPEVNDEINKLLEQDNEFIEDLRSKHVDLNIVFGMKENKIDIEVTYKED